MTEMPAVRPGRKILGVSAVLLPLIGPEQVDWPGLRAHVERTLQAGLIPAVNMDTGYGHLLDDATYLRVLEEAKSVCGAQQFVAGAIVVDSPGDPFNAAAYQRRIDGIQNFGGVPVIFQSFGLVQLEPEECLSAYESLGANTDEFIGFELGDMFAPFGRIYSLEFYERWIQIPQCIGAKHSSLNRIQEWKRLAIRDRVRPDFRVFTGNDLAIDMVMYGSDYLLGLSTMAPDWFAHRDRLWEQSDPEFYQWNDWLQYLGFFTFRSPTPAYKHSAAQFLHLRGWIETNLTFPGSPKRSDSDLEVLSTFLSQAPLLAPEGG
jgi:dihydrodipicolinate synthase/N-acetylneuraminate lyase